jgi:hypothetical protein
MDGEVKFPEVKGWGAKELLLGSCAFPFLAPEF